MIFFVLCGIISLPKGKDIFVDMYDNVENLLISHGINYIKQGDEIKCLCPNPSHHDKHIGSFSFNLTKGVGRCFACDCRVNLVSFNRLLGEKVTYADENNFNYTMSLRPEKKKEVVYSKPIVYGKLYSPRYNNEVMNFLHSIGFTDEFIDEKRVKYCRYCEMISEDLLGDIEKSPTVMCDRICIPIYKNGELVNYECRTFSGESPKVKYVNGCKVNLIYNYENLDLSKDVILTESIKNLAKGWSVNKNIISIFGNQITDVKAEMLNKIPSLTVFLDYDDGGLMMLRKLRECYYGNLKVTFCPKKYKNEKGELKGYDMNDCTLDEIKFYLENTMSAQKAERKLSGEEQSIFW